MTPLSPRAPHPARVIAAQALWDTKLALTHGEQVMLSLILPCLALIGFTQTSVLSITPPDGASMVDLITPGVIALAVLSSAFTGQAIGTGFDRRAGVLTFLATTTLGRTGFVAGRCASLVLQQAVQVTVISVVAAMLGWRPDPIAFLPAAALIALGSVALTSLGLALAGTVRAEAVLAVANIAWVVFAGAGVLLPVTTLPSGLAVVQWLPSTALADALRMVFLGSGFDATSVLALLLWSVVGVFVATRWFRWQS